MAKRASKHSEHRALALSRSEKHNRHVGAHFHMQRNLDAQTQSTTLWSRKWVKKPLSDHDIWCYITMRWPTLSQEEKQRIFKGVTEHSYRIYVAPVDRFIVVNKANKRNPTL